MVKKIDVGLSPQERAQAASLCAALRTLRSADPKLSLEEAYALLTVASRPGVMQKEVAEELGLSSGSLSRVFGHLTERGDKRTDGLKLIRTEDDKTDWRQKLNFLTPSGEVLVRAALRDAADGGKDVGPPEG